MSSKRKITVSSSSSSRRSRSSERDAEYQGYHQQSQQLPPRQRPSVFSRLGTKRSGPGIPLPPGVSDKPRGNMPIQCRNILESGTCKFDSKCKYAHTHKMAMQTRDRLKMRGPTGLGSKRTNSPSVDTNWENWNEESLDYEDERMLEKKRQILERELAKGSSDSENDQMPKKKVLSKVIAQTPPPSQTSKKQQSTVSSSSSSSSGSSSDSSSSSSSSGSSDEQDRPIKTPPKKKARVSSGSRKRRDSSSSSSDEKQAPKLKSSVVARKGKTTPKKGKILTKKDIKKKTKLTSSAEKRKAKLSSSAKKKILEKRKLSPAASRTRDGDKKDKSPSNADSKTPVIRKGFEVDRFGFYHAQPVQAAAAASSSSSYETTSRHAETRVSKRSTSSERRPLTPTPSLKREGRSSGSPPRKRRSSPPPTSSSSTKSKPSFTALASRSGSLGKGGQDRDLRESHPRSRSASWKRSSLSPQRSRGGVKKAKVHNRKAPIGGANAVSIDSSDVHHPRSRGASSSSRRPASPVERGLRRNRSRSNERLLPPQALQQKNPLPTSSTQKRSSSERSSNKNSRERSVPLKSPQEPTKTEEHGELSAAEDFSDIGESDEEILNQDNIEDMPEEKEPEETHNDQESPTPAANVEEASNDSDSKMKESDLLEGISEEELDVSDDEKDKVKVADALGVDWSQLITPKEVKENKVAGSFRKQWTPGAIFSRIGLPKSLLKPGLYDEIIEKLNKEGDPVEILHPVAFVHCYKKNQLEKQAQDAKVTKPMMSARSEMQWRRKLMGLPPLKGPISLDIY